MHITKKKRLELAGWVVGDTAQFLQLSDEESRFLELKLAHAARVRELREQRGLTQAALAHQLGWSQSRVAKIEAADRSVSLDLNGAIAAELGRHRQRNRQMCQTRQVQPPVDPVVAVFHVMIPMADVVRFECIGEPLDRSGPGSP